MTLPRYKLCLKRDGLVFQDTGGRPISHYIVEKKDKKSGVWTPISKFCRTPMYDVTGLEEGEQYEFRVSAVNDQGQSEPLVTDRPIIAKHQFGKNSCFGHFLHSSDILWFFHSQ